jgi:hypothetical protein
MGSEEIDETPTGVLASGGDPGRLGQRNHQLVDGASPGKGMCFCTLTIPKLRLKSAGKRSPDVSSRGLPASRYCNEVREAADVFVVARVQPIAHITSMARFSPRSVRNRRNSRAG